MNVDDDAADQIIAAHVETVDEIKSERDELKQKAAEADDLKAEVESLRNGDFEAKYQAEHQAFEDFKANVAAKKTEAEKSGLYRNLLLEAGVDPKRVDSVMRVADLKAIEVADGKIADADKVTEGIKSEWADFIVSRTTGPAPVSKPPRNGNGNAVTAEQFKGMSIRERNELYKTDPTTYQSLAKTKE